MKFAIVLCALVVIIATFTNAVPLEHEDEGYVLSRPRRATCDLLSVSTPIGSLNHAACAAHCLAMRRGFRGGRCRDGVCHCRK